MADAKSTRETRTRAKTREKIINVDDEIEGSGDEEKTQLKAIVKKVRQNAPKSGPKKAQLARNATLAKKANIYADARKRGEEISQRGANFIEEARDHVKALRAQETTMEKCCSEYEDLSSNLEAAYERLRSTYPPVFEELGPRRSKVINDSSCLLKNNKPRRDAALKQIMLNATRQMREAKANEKANTDAAEMIKHMKALLRF